MQKIDTGIPIGVTADIEGLDPADTILAGAKDGVTKFHLRTREHEYIAKYWQGPDAQEKSRRFVEYTSGLTSATGLIVGIVCDPTMAL